MTYLCKKAKCTGIILYLHKQSFQNMFKIILAIFHNIMITMMMTLNEG